MNTTKFYSVSVLAFLAMLLSFNSNADDYFRTATHKGTLISVKPIIINDSVSPHDINDYFSFQVNSKARVLITLTNLRDDANLGLYDANNKMLGISTNQARANETIQANLAPGKYVVRVASNRLIADTTYTLKIATGLRGGIPVPNPRPAPIPRPVPNPIPRPNPIPIPRPTPAPQPAPPQIGQIFIRGLSYADHTAQARLPQRQASVNGSFNLSVSSMNFNSGTVKVILQDVNRSGGFGSTVFELKSFTRQGSRLVVRGPGLPHIFANRTYHLTVFQYLPGGVRNYASLGNITLR